MTVYEKKSDYIPPEGKGKLQIENKMLKNATRTKRQSPFENEL